MAKTVMIPSSDQEMWVCRINHKEYSYPQGTQQSVPDEVAELIASINAQEVKATPEEQATWEVYSQGGWIPMQGGDSLPDTTSASEGDVLSLNASKEPVWSAPSGGGGGVIFTIDSENPITATIGGQTITLYKTNKTWSEFYGAITSGKNLIKFDETDLIYTYVTKAVDESFGEINSVELTLGVITAPFMEYDGYACQVSEE